MKFIFPTNYNFRNKILGVLDYPTAIFNVFYFCILLFSIVGFNHENILYSLYYIIKYFIKPKIYLYK